MSQSADLGLVGLGVMGRNLALNFSDHGFKIAAYDPWPEARKAATGILPLVVDNDDDLVAALKPPQTVLLLVKAGDPTDAQIEALVPLLSPGATIIDGGNTNWHDSQRRAERLAKVGIGFMGMGVSGGEEGARHGPCLMAGGDETAFARLRPMLEAIAAHIDEDPCCGWFGAGGAGHLVKTLHNGIEYADMQAIAEAYTLLRDRCGLSNAAMAAVFEGWNSGPLGSYLVEITAAVLRRHDDLGDGDLVDQVLDKAAQKGTGQWSATEALALGIPAPTIAEAVSARSLSALRDERLIAADRIAAPVPASQEPLDVADIESALLATRICAYAQGFAVIAAASAEHGWNTDLSEAARVWRGGCIIRATLLEPIRTAMQLTPPPANLLVADGIREMLAEAAPGWRRTIADAVTSGLPVPAMASALAYVDGYRSARTSANLIQALRDCFGAHTYERLDRPGTFHTNWLES